MIPLTFAPWKIVLSKVIGILFISLAIIGGIGEINQSFSPYKTGYNIKNYVLCFFLIYFGILLWFYKQPYFNNGYSFLHFIFKNLGYFFVSLSIYGLSYELESYLNRKNNGVLSGIGYNIIVFGWGMGCLYFCKKLQFVSTKLKKQNEFHWNRIYNSNQGYKVHTKTCDGCGFSD